MKMGMKKSLLLALGLLLATSALAESPSNYCGPLKGRHYGPFDYRLRSTFNIEIVETAHFTPEVEAGVSGSSSYLGDDLSYTLIAIPNHPRALNTMAKLGLRDKKVKVDHAKYPVACYFDRAIRFAPDDGTVRALYGSYLMAQGKLDEAQGMFAAAVNLSPEDATINYNAGLLYFKKKNYEKAMLYAKKAYDQDFPLPGLKKMLQQAGKWDESVQAAQSATPPVPPQQSTQ